MIYLDLDGVMCDLVVGDAWRHVDIIKMETKA